MSQLKSLMMISIHTLRVEGDASVNASCLFSAVISIHTLRVEGDFGMPIFFNVTKIFQSTPSVWRVTDGFIGALKDIQFQSTPSVWRVTNGTRNKVYGITISIHTLRVEGDLMLFVQSRIP